MKNGKFALIAAMLSLYAFGDGRLFWGHLCRGLMAVGFLRGFSFMKGLILSSLVCVLSFVVEAKESQSVDGVMWFFEKCYDNNSRIYFAKIVSPSGDYEYKGDLSVPLALKGLPVKEIGMRAFERCDGLTSITIPSSVDYIESFAFSHCQKLTTVRISPGVRDIGTGAFDGCRALETFEVDNENEVFTSHDGVLYGPSSVYRCPEGKKGQVTILPSVRSVEYGAFRDCSEVTSVLIPDGVTYIGQYAFAGCSGLDSIKLPSGLTMVYDKVFLGCSGLTAMVIPSGVTDIGRSAFAGCCGIESVTIPFGVKTISDSAFSGCSVLSSVTIPTSVTSVGSGAFSDCSGLVSVTIPACVESLPTVFSGGCYTNISEVILQNGVTRIAAHAFSFCLGLKSITIPSSVKSVGYGAFEGCRSLAKITLPEELVSIGGYAFDGCSSLETIIIPSGVMSIDEYAFRDCSAMTSISVAAGNGVFSSLGGVLYNKEATVLIQCPAGKKGVVELSDIVMGIKRGALDGCSELTDFLVADGNVSFCSLGGILYNKECGELIRCPQGKSGFLEIPNCVKSIADLAFSCCSMIKSVMIPEGVKNIGNDSFSFCSSLESLSLPSTVTNVGWYAFMGCSNVASVVIPEGVVSIKGYAFSGCSGLASVTIPMSVKEIGEQTFFGCGKLVSVTLLNGVERIGDYAFCNCSCLMSVSIPPSVISIASGAFLSCGNLKVVYVSKEDAERVKSLYAWPGAVKFVVLQAPSLDSDPEAIVTGDPENGFVIKPSAGNLTVEMSIPQGVDADKVTVELSVKVKSVKPNGANIKIVSEGGDITEFLKVPDSDENGVVDLTKATVKDEIIKEALDVEKGAKIELNAMEPKLTTSNTRIGLSYRLWEGETMSGMMSGDSRIGNGEPWSPKIKVKGGKSAFYSIEVGKGE